MESAFYPVVTIETEEELDTVRKYCDEHKIDFQFLDEDLNKLPTQILLYINKEDFELFLGGIS